jgi:hypothetical protein
MTVYCPMFLGQWGYVFSMGMVYLASKIRAIGAETQLFGDGDFERGRTWINYKQHAGYKIAGVGFSLGNTSLTYLLATGVHTDAALCIAMSLYAGPNNQQIKQSSSPRRCLWFDPDRDEQMSAGGQQLQWDQKVEVHIPHFYMPMHPTVVAGVLAEVKKLQ